MCWKKSDSAILQSIRRWGSYPRCLVPKFSALSSALYFIFIIKYSTKFDPNRLSSPSTKVLSGNSCLHHLPKLASHFTSTQANRSAISIGRKHLPPNWSLGRRSSAKTQDSVKTTVSRPVCLPLRGYFHLQTFHCLNASESSVGLTHSRVFVLGSWFSGKSEVSRAV